MACLHPDHRSGQLGGHVPGRARVLVNWLKEICNRHFRPNRPADWLSACMSAFQPFPPTSSLVFTLIIGNDVSESGETDSPVLCTMANL